MLVISLLRIFIHDLVDLLLIKVHWNFVFVISHLQVRLIFRNNQVLSLVLIVDVRYWNVHCWSYEVTLRKIKLLKPSLVIISYIMLSFPPFVFRLITIHPVSIISIKRFDIRYRLSMIENAIIINRFMHLIEVRWIVWVKILASLLNIWILIFLLAFIQYVGFVLVCLVAHWLIIVKLKVSSFVSKIREAFQFIIRYHYA